MGGISDSGIRREDSVSTCPQHSVVRQRQNHFKLYDFQLVSLKSLLY
jgi:hypothetical protein